MFDGRWRSSIEVGLKPIGRNLQRAGVRTDHLTIVGIVMATGAAVAIGAGYLRLGLVLMILTGIPDALDGAVAKASGTSSVRGAYFDSVADRLTDALLLGGVSWYLASTEPGHISVLPFAVYAAAALVSYQRAKADALGFDARGGLMERAERFIVLGVGLLFDEILIGVLWLMFVATAGTAIYRFVKVWRQADRPPTAEPPAPGPRRRRSGRRTARPVSAAWRERARARNKS
jgi:CDP-diacylglycerol--glycerol-3-phosphate 3-phosphatidyltransferase